jgi:Chaperone of endosialidase
MKTTVPTVLIIFALICFALLQNTPAVSPTPDGGYFGANTAEGGAGALFSLTTGTNNTAIGSQALYSLSTGVQNTALGAQALKNNTADKNTAVGFNALVSNTTGSDNTAIGWRALFKNRTGVFNTANGEEALNHNTTGVSNTANGVQALFLNTAGFQNTANGVSALAGNITGGNNTASGYAALWQNTTGRNNIALGYLAGQNLTGNYNIAICNDGVAGENGTVRIGDTQTATYIAGISGTAVVGETVVVDANGQLGTATSSARFKKDIKPMQKASESILALKPVSFRYKKEIDAKGIPQFGLIAEDVAKVNPNLVVRDRNGEIYSVRYEAVNAMLLNEFLKEHRTVQEQKATIAQLKNDFAEQQKQIEALTTGLQKVSAQLEVSKLAPQTVKNAD